MTGTLAETKSMNSPYLFKPSATETQISRKREEPKPIYENLVEGSGSKFTILLSSFSYKAEEIDIDVSESKDFEQINIALVKLDELKNETDLNPLITPMSNRAYKAAKDWLAVALKIQSELDMPRVLLTGDGGVAIEWKLESNYVSIHFDEADSEMDMIFYKFDGDRNYKDLNKSNLTQLFHQLSNNGYL